MGCVVLGMGVPQPPPPNRRWVVVVGDSLLRGTEPSICHPDLESWEVGCLPGARIQDVTERLTKLIKRSDRYPFLLLHVGTNNTAKNDLEQALSSPSARPVPKNSGKMEDEEGYTVLNLRPKVGNSARLSPAGHQDSLPCPHWHGVALKAGSAGLLLLLATVAGLGVWVFQGCPSKAEERPAWTSDGVTPITSNGRAYNSSLEDLVSRLKQSVCDPAQINSAGGARCKLCPVNWRLHEDKCYWLSKELNSWSKSREDCTRKGSEMLVIQNTEQMVPCIVCRAQREPFLVSPFSATCLCTGVSKLHCPTTSF